jgi:hypothetical protein
MDETAKKLAEETEKWKTKIESEIISVKITGKKSKELMENINAYIKDSDYFLSKKDYIRAFEAIIWAWALYETGKREEIL